MIIEDDFDAFLEHHGIKGMRWGFRKKEEDVSKIIADKEKILDVLIKERALRTRQFQRGKKARAIYKEWDKLDPKDPSYHKKSAAFKEQQDHIFREGSKDHQETRAQYDHEPGAVVPPWGIKKFHREVNEGRHPAALSDTHLNTHIARLKRELKALKHDDFNDESEQEVNSFLEHHGIKGQHWGIRNKFVQVSKTIGRGAKKAGKFAYTHPHTTAAVAVGGAALTAAFLHHHGNKPVTRIFQTPYSNSGQRWITNYPKNLPINQLWNYKP